MKKVQWVSVSLVSIGSILTACGAQEGGVKEATTSSIEAVAPLQKAAPAGAKVKTFLDSKKGGTPVKTKESRVWCVSGQF